jgi:UDP-N-acetylglucosamine 3-dehydrogenase
MLRAGVIGMGVMGKRHARVWATTPGVQLVAVADPVVREPAPNLVVIYVDYLLMLADEHLDVVSVAVPTSLHKEVTIAALQAGCHVLVEKPIAVDRDEARGMIEAARACGKILSVGHIERFNPAIRELKRMLDAGTLGHIYQIYASRSGPFPKRIRDVGVVIDLAPHDLDIMRFLLHSEPVRIYAEMERREAEHEDIFSGLLRFANGTIGVLNIHWLAPTKFPHMLTVTGERGVFQLNHDDQHLSFFGFDGGYQQIEVEHREPLAIELEEFALAVLNRSPAPVDPGDATIALQLSRAMIAAARFGSVISGQNLSRLVAP